MTSVLTLIARQRDAAFKAAQDLVAEAEGGLRSMSLRWADDVESRLDDVARAAERLDRVAVSVRSEPSTYREDGAHSYFLDLVRQRTGDKDASDRLKRHQQEMAVELERREILHRRAWERAAEALGMTREARDLTRVDGSAGNFVPPLWLFDQVGTSPRAGRALANRTTAIPLPTGTDSVSVPRLITGSAVAVQASDNAAVQETDPADTGVTAPVRTIAGHVDAALQLVDQAGAPGFDRLIYSDLLSDYDRQLETQLIAGSGASGQISGLLTSPGTTVTYTSATPTVAATVSKVGDLASQVTTARQQVPSLVLMHPRRGFWLMSQSDGQSRPFNPVDLAASERDPNAEPVGSLLGMALVLDPAVPTNLGAGTNEDRVVVTRAADLLLLEGEPRLTVNVDVLSGTLGVRFGLHRFVAFVAGRVPSSTGVLNGTGLAGPTFA